MINAFLRDIDRHIVCESTNLQATYDARHMYNVLATADIDNGRMVDLDKAKYLADDYYEMTEPTGSTTRVGLILSVPIGPDERPYKATLEYNFYNGKGEIMRVYDLMVGDKFTISENGIKAISTSKPLDKGQFVVLNGYNLEAAESAGTGVFSGEIVKKIKRSGGNFYTVLVRKNGNLH